LGPAFTINLPVFGPSVVVSDRELIKDVFTLPGDAVRGVEPNLSSVVGSGSMFGLQGADHLRRRKLLTPPFHGKRMRAYETLVEKSFEGRPHIGRRARIPGPPVDDADNTQHHPAVGLRRRRQRTCSAAIFDAAHRYCGIPACDASMAAPRSRTVESLATVPGHAREFDATVDSLIMFARHDRHFEHRDDVLSLMLRAHYDDGGAMSTSEIKDELLGLVGAGHETTAITLSWAVERLRRHPQFLDHLVADVDAGQSAPHCRSVRGATNQAHDRCRRTSSYRTFDRLRALGDSARLHRRREHRPQPRK
jgi:cytochrome P450